MKTYFTRFSVGFVILGAWMSSSLLHAQTYINENFSTGTGTTPPAGWTQNKIAGSGSSDFWNFSNPAGRTISAPMSSPAAIFDSDFMATFVNENVALESPAVNTTGSSVVYLKWDQFFAGIYNTGFDGIYAEVFDGTTWNTVYSNTTQSYPGAAGSFDIDVSAYAANKPSVKVRFRFVGNYSWWWIVDNVQLYVPNTPPAFVSASPQTLTLCQNATATDLSALLHINDPDAAQTITWSEQSAPDQGGTLNFTSATAASGSSDITPGGTITYTPSGSYSGLETFVITASDGVASTTMTVNVTVNATSTGDTTAVACDSFTWFGSTYSTSGDQTHTLTNMAGCDSVVTLHLTINNSTTGDTTAIACDSFTWYGSTYNTSGDQTHLLTTLAGCDSTVTLHLTINNSNTGDTTAVACESFTWFGTTYTTSGDQTHTLTNMVGCDSVVTLHLTIDNIDLTTTTTDITISANQVGATYQWLDCGNGNSPLAGETNQDFVAQVNGNYAVEITNGTCVDTSACVLINSVGLNSVTETIQIYPNPFSSQFVVRGVVPGSAISVYNALGQEILKTVANSSLVEINLENQQQGVYYIRVGQQLPYKLIKQQ